MIYQQHISIILLVKKTAFFSEEDLNGSFLFSPFSRISTSLPGTYMSGVLAEVHVNNAVFS